MGFLKSILMVFECGEAEPVKREKHIPYFNWIKSVLNDLWYNHDIYSHKQEIIHFRYQFNKLLRDKDCEWLQSLKKNRPPEELKISIWRIVFGLKYHNWDDYPRLTVINVYIQTSKWEEKILEFEYLKPTIWDQEPKEPGKIILDWPWITGFNEWFDFEYEKLRVSNELKVKQEEQEQLQKQILEEQAEREKLRNLINERNTWKPTDYKLDDDLK